MIEKEKIRAGRRAVDAYRLAHTQLYLQPWHKGIPEEHTPLFNIMLGTFRELGFNTTQEFFDASKLLNIQETGIFDVETRRNREDLSLLGLSSEVAYGDVAVDDTVVLRLVEIKGEKEAELFIDGRSVMSTIPEEHISMKEAVELCPSNSRVFVGGLGLALVLLYLAQSGKTTDVIVCEIDKHVIQMLGSRISQWFTDNYPGFNLSILHGDVFEEIKKQGQFDWVYIDLTAGAPSDFEILASSALTDTGIYTAYQPYIDEGWK